MTEKTIKLTAWDAIVQRCEELTKVECDTCDTNDWCPVHDGPKPTVTAPLHD